MQSVQPIHWEFFVISILYEVLADKVGHFRDASSWHLVRSMQHCSYASLHGVCVCHTYLTLAKLNVPSLESLLIICEKIKCILLWCMGSQAECSLWAKHTGFYWVVEEFEDTTCSWMFTHTVSCVASPCLVLTKGSVLSVLQNVVIPWSRNSLFYCRPLKYRLLAACGGPNFAQTWFCHGA